MPSRELGSSLDSSERVHGVGTTLFKKHKILPHPRHERVPDVNPTTPANKPRSLVIDTGTSSIHSSNTSSPPTLKHTSKRIGSLPPTPPTHSRQFSGNYVTSSAASKDDLSSKASSNTVSVPSTPILDRSPPTPDVTPPRKIPLAFRPQPSDRYPSSRADSFKTALEDQDSSDEDQVSTVRPIPYSARTSATEVPQVPKIPASFHKQKEVGLGLGLKSDRRATTPQAVESPVQEFHVYDGEWGSESSEVEREWDDNLMRNVTVRKRPGRVLHIDMNESMDEVLEDDIVSPTKAALVVREMPLQERSLPLQERIARHRKQLGSDRSVSDLFAQRVPGPSTDESPVTPDVRRFSAMSARSGSTIIGAIVVDAPPSRRKTLRHTKKHLGLRDFSSDQSTIKSAPSAPNSVISSERMHRLHHSTGKIPERRHRSQQSNGTVSSTSSGKARREVLKTGGIPVVVIPDRHSSTRSSKAPSLRSTSSRKTKRSVSLSSAPLSNSSKFNEPGYFDTLPQRKRTLSESAGSGDDSIHTLDFPPHIPARRSSLSAPTSRNASRAGSLTAESLKAHNKIQAKSKEQSEPQRLETQPAKSYRSIDSHKDQGSHSSHFDHNGDPFFGKRLSAQVTPFSVMSYETAGTNPEVSEAMAVSIYPHQNKSLLVVQHASSEPSPPTLKASEIPQSAPPSMALNGEPTSSCTPPQPIHSMDEVDSPLQNPRIPPEPPAIKFIPATPSGLTPGQEEQRQLGYDLLDIEEEGPTISDNKPSRGMSLIRRFSKRRNSDPATHIQPGLLKRTFSLSNRARRDHADEGTQTSKGNANPSTLYPSVEDRPADGSKLHPFWRPSHFWDDLEDEGFADDELNGGYPIIDNRPPPPKRSLSGKLKRTFAILPIQDNHDFRPSSKGQMTMRNSTSGNLRVVKQRSNSSLRRSGSNRGNYAEGPEPKEESFGYGFKEGNGGRVHTIPGIGLRVEYVGWGGMKRKLNEKRRQQRVEKLRASISHPRGVQSGINDVLQRKRMV